MPKVKLTDAFVKSAKAMPTVTGKLVVTEYADETISGLALRVTPAGVKSWTYRYRSKGKQKCLSLGKADVVSLANARQAAKVEIGKVAAGGDPVRDELLAKAGSVENFALRTIKQVGDWYFQECAVGRRKPNAKGQRPKKQSTLELEQYYFDAHIVPTLGKHDLTDLARGHVQKFVNDLAKNAADSTRGAVG